MKTHSVKKQTNSNRGEPSVHAGRNTSYCGNWCLTHRWNISLVTVVLHQQRTERGMGKYEISGRSHSQPLCTKLTGVVEEWITLATSSNRGRHLDLVCWASVVNRDIQLKISTSAMDEDSKKLHFKILRTSRQPGANAFFPELNVSYSLLLFWYYIHIVGYCHIRILSNLHTHSQDSLPCSW